MINPRKYNLKFSVEVVKFVVLYNYLIIYLLTSRLDRFETSSQNASTPARDIIPL